jgi:hypothetical protein
MLGKHFTLNFVSSHFVFETSSWQYLFLGWACPLACASRVAWIMGICQSDLADLYFKYQDFFLKIMSISQI